MIRACVVGWPIKHSRSPLIHGYWLKRYGIAGSYTKEAVPEADIEAFLASLNARGFAGCNVTVPHKEAAFAVAARREAAAEAIGAANTLWLEHGQLVCTNTDSYGFMTNLQRSVPSWRPALGHALVLGAGGSARAVIYGLLQSGVPQVRVANRSIERADALALHFGARVTALPWAERNAHVAGAGVIVNTTTLGMNGAGDPGLDFSQASASAVAADLVYVPLKTAFLRAAELAGLATAGGLGMLLHQAVPGFEKWFGMRPEVTPELVDLIIRDIGEAAC